MCRARTPLCLICVSASKRSSLLPDCPVLNSPVQASGRYHLQKTYSVLGRERKINEKTGSGGQSKGAGWWHSPVSHWRANLSYFCMRVVAARLDSAPAVCGGVAGVAEPSVLSSFPCWSPDSVSCGVATRLPLEQIASCTSCQACADGPWWRC